MQLEKKKVSDRRSAPLKGSKKKEKRTGKRTEKNPTEIRKGEKVSLFSWKTKYREEVSKISLKKGKGPEDLLQ